MLTVYIDHKATRLKVDNQRLGIEGDTRLHRSIPLRQIERIVIGAPLDIPSSALLQLVEHGISLTVIHAHKPEHCAILTGMLHNDAWRRQTQYKIVHNAELCAMYAHRLVRGKLKGQRRMLRHLMHVRQDQRSVLLEGIRRMDAVLLHLAEDELIQKDVDRMRGIEGAGASAYFAAFTQVFPPALSFTGRNRRPPRDPVNAVLSLSYTLAYSEAQRMLISVGLDPALGFFHTLDYGRPSLACDLVELIRPAVDHFVWDLFRNETLRPEHFTSNEQGCMMGKAGRSHFYAAWSSILPEILKRTRRITRLWIEELRKQEDVINHE